MSGLWPVAAILLGVIPIGWLAARADRSERFARRIGAVILAVLLVGLAISIGRGELLRFAAGADDSDGGSAPGIR